MVMRRLRLFRRSFAPEPLPVAQLGHSRNSARGGRARKVSAPLGAPALCDRPDEEVQPGPQRRFAAEAEHGMQTWFNWQQAPDADEDQDFHDFYETKVKEMQDKQGGRESFPISGNLYMYWYLAGFGDDSELFLKKSGFFVYLGLTVIIIVQLFGPMVVLSAAVYDIQFDHGVFGLDAFNYQFGSETNGVSFIGQRFLGFFFLILFIMNGMYVLRSDRAETKKLFELGELFNQEAEEHGYRKPKGCWLWLGACINSFCLLACSVAMCFLFIIEEGPKDVLFDAFGLTFLYNLDDIGGDLAFLDEKWDEDFMGDMYGALFNSPTGILEEIKAKRKEEFTPDNIYQLAEWVMWLMLFVLPLTFMFVDMTPKAENRRLGDMVPAQEHAELSQATVGKLLRILMDAGLNSTHA